MGETTRAYARTYKLYDEDLDPLTYNWKDVVVLGACLEDCDLRTIDAFGHTCRLSLAGDDIEVPAEGYPRRFSEPDEYGLVTMSHDVPWQDVLIAVFASPVAPETLDGWFADCLSLTEIRGLGLLDTSHVRSMVDTFMLCQSLRELDLSGFDTSLVEDMNGLFCDCEAIAELDISNFDTARVMDMRNMFAQCRALRELDLSGFDTARVTNMANMLNGCSSLQGINLSGLNTSQVTDMSNLFWGCSSLQGLDLSGFDLSSAEAFAFMFADCSSLRSLSLPGARPGTVHEARQTRNMFRGTGGLGMAPEELTELFLSGAGVHVG